MAHVHLGDLIIDDASPAQNGGLRVLARGNLSNSGDMLVTAPFAQSQMVDMLLCVGWFSGPPLNDVKEGP
jgi:hypothetical protein